MKCLKQAKHFNLLIIASMLACMLVLIYMSLNIHGCRLINGSMQYLTFLWCIVFSVIFCRMEIMFRQTLKSQCRFIKCDICQGCL